MNENDHDLLIQIKTTLDRAILDIKELRDNTTARVTALEEEKIGQKEFYDYKSNAEEQRDDHEKRLRRLERWALLLIGALSLVEIIFQIIFHK